MALEVVGSTPITHPKHKKHPVWGAFCVLAVGGAERTHHALRFFEILSARSARGGEERRSACGGGAATKTFFRSRTVCENDRHPITHPKRKKHPVRGAFCVWAVGGAERTHRASITFFCGFCLICVPPYLDFCPPSCYNIHSYLKGALLWNRSSAFRPKQYAATIHG